MTTATAADHMTGDYLALYRQWLQPNGIDGWLPEHPRIVVDTAARTVTWPQWRHEHGKGGPWCKDDLMVESDLWTAEERRSRPLSEDRALVDERTTPLTTPVTDSIRTLCRKTGVELVER